MPDEIVDPPNKPDPFKVRRDTRDDLRNWLTFLFGLIPVLTAALGFSPLTNIWTFVALLMSFILVLASVWAHHRDKNIFKNVATAGTATAGRLIKPLSKRQMLVQRAAVIALILGAGAWIGSSARNLFLLSIYGTLGDLAISPGAMADPAVISLRKDGPLVCFFTTATFNVRNATSNDILIGALSNSLSMADDTNAPIFMTRTIADVTASSGGVSGVALIKGTPEDWSKNFANIRDHLTTLRRGADINITIFQNRDYNNTCLLDPDGKTTQNYKASTVKMSGELVMVLPDGTWRRENFGLGEPAKVVK